MKRKYRDHLNMNEVRSEEQEMLHGQHVKDLSYKVEVTNGCDGDLNLGGHRRREHADIQNFVELDHKRHASPSEPRHMVSSFGPENQQDRALALLEDV
jgi:hypothetical protein